MCVLVGMVSHKYSMAKEVNPVYMQKYQGESSMKSNSKFGENRRFS